VGKSKAPPSRRFKSVRRHSQERLRTCPGLCGPDFRSVWKRVKPLVQSLLCVCAIYVAELRKASVPRAKLNQFASRLVAQDADKHTSATRLSALGVLPLPRFVGQFLGFNCGALSGNAVGKFAVAAPTFSREAPIAVPPLGSAYLVASRPVAGSGTFLPRSVFVEAFRISGAAGPVHCPLNTPRLLARLNHRRAKRFEDGFGLPDRCYVAGADVQPDYAAFCFASQRVTPS
jgi:hypothetical protein